MGSPSHPSSRRFAGILIAAALLGGLTARAARAQARLPPALELRVPKPPTVATGEAGSFLAYELHVTNFATQPMTLQRVEVLRGEGQGGQVLLSLADSALARSITRPGVAAPPGERARLGGGARAVVFLWVPIERGSPPSTVWNRVVVEQGSADSARTQDLAGPAVSVAPESTPIGPPLRGGVWLAGNGPAPETGHRRALIAVGGSPAIAQRFAIDYVKVGENDRTFEGDPLKNESYHAYGEDALAVADGVVADARDGIPENVPGITSRAVPITLETVGGNYVILDVGGGRYAFYAHLQPGSLRVKVGDRVRRGQVLGLVGNSGNSTEPHLHFHIADGTSPLGSEGLPYRYDTFDRVGQCRTFNTACARTAPTAQRGQLPLANMLLRFPS